jgi:hypothetical protein
VKRPLLVAVLVAGLVFGISALADAYQDRIDDDARDHTTRVVFEARSKRLAGGDDWAGTALWATCAGLLRDNEPALPEHTDQGFEVVLTPGLGQHAVRKLTGCLEDHTLDRIQGRVVRIDRR